MPVVERDEDDRRDRAEEENYQRGWQDAARAPCPERGHRHGAGAVDLAQQVRRDQEAGDREEHVDADEAARQQCRPEVVDDDKRDGSGAQRLDLGADFLGQLVHGANVGPPRSPR